MAVSVWFHAATAPSVKLLFRRLTQPRKAYRDMSTSSLLVCESSPGPGQDDILLILLYATRLVDFSIYCRLLYTVLLTLLSRPSEVESYRTMECKILL